MREGQRMAVIGAVAAAVVGAAGFGAYALVGSGDDESSDQSRSSGSDAGESKSESVETGPPSTEEVRATAKKFLTAWEAGDIADAAALTDDKAAATKALTSFAKDGKVGTVTTSGSSASGGTVAYSVVAEISHGELATTLDYRTKLKVERDTSSGKVVVDWQPTVLHPELRKGQTLVTDAAGDPPITAVDRNGKELTKQAHPELGDILDDLRKRYGDKTDGTAGVETRIVTQPKGEKGEESEKAKDAKTLKVLSKGTPGQLKTTLDADLQKAAMKALDGRAKGSAVAIKPSTGELLAIANTPATGFNSAIRGSLAPGSTWKIVTAGMLLDKGLAESAAKHPCPKYFTYGGWKFQNLDKFEIKDGTFADSFAASCNTAFISRAPKLENGDLGSYARNTFGLGLDWQVGTGTFDGAVPTQSDAQMAASLIGQGAVRMNPMTMASVAATVKDGSFKQPIIVSPSLDNRQVAKAPNGLSAGTAGELRALMKRTATNGTAAEAMASVGGDKGAKTGSAEVDGQKKPNAWFTAYKDDLAVAAVIPNSGHGGKNAGPVVATILNAG
ncbi:penicillin-binding protein [Streptomyces sp. XM4193]|uniref:penicillin-binding transpeptidase domain-containing protein n=1 Tax=Streptomyces sp. XM4193 TaxID=2929782 RepID=UPI001FF855D3|nr:penicillin-binding transpeptidase domain-containing protein [Streptomyces sp. XM4193]MCK1796834.1 penicillin-binding protein [Streptomyces sp. XM4193]